MYTISRWTPIRSLTSLQEQVNRLGDSSASRSANAETDLATWAPPVDIYETEGELVVKADLPDLDEKDIDVRIENNVLTIRGERKFEKTISQDSYLRVERTYGAFSRSFSLANTIDSEQIHAEYRNGVLSVRMPKREESKPKQIKVSVSANQAK
jgi:HSP20 family protein